MFGHRAIQEICALQDELVEKAGIGPKPAVETPPNPMARLLQSFEVLLAGATAAPEKTVGELPLLTGEERKQWLQPLPAPTSPTVPELLARRAASTPTAVAVVREGRAWTLGELMTRVQGLAARLHTLGVKRGEPVVVCLEPSPEKLLALWGVMEAGASVMTLGPSELGSLPAWLHTIARNRTVDRLRAAGRRPSLVALSAATREDESVDAAMDRLATTGKAVSASVSQPDPESAAVGAWTRRRLHEALAGMPEDERTVIVMAYDDELSQSEIAGRLGWPIGTVKTRTRRALRRLRAMLETDLGPERALTEPAFAGRGGTDAAR